MYVSWHLELSLECPHRIEPRQLNARAANAHFRSTQIRFEILQFFNIAAL